MLAQIWIKSKPSFFTLVVLLLMAKYMWYLDGLPGSAGVDIYSSPGPKNLAWTEGHASSHFLLLMFMIMYRIEIQYVDEFAGKKQK